MQQKETIDKLSVVAPCTKKQGMLVHTLKSIFSLFKHISITPFKG